MNVGNYAAITDRVFELIRNLDDNDFESLVETLRMNRAALETAKGLPPEVLRAALEIFERGKTLDLSLEDEVIGDYPGRG